MPIHAVNFSLEGELLRVWLVADKMTFVNSRSTQTLRKPLIDAVIAADIEGFLADPGPREMPPVPPESLRCEVSTTVPPGGLNTTRGRRDALAAIRAQLDSVLASAPDYRPDGG